ncbi:nitroreductase family protein [Caldisericum exile]|uniref:Oxidoreductase n=1 Tax=Caldisericum exile (strain DSM 21853 / NBRC 104410 / AZM16c01) TaxID=511051 RepID=A0A7U6GDM8_CALEA|nr:nitroreductase family protein [Caldisericum exile]BAL80382.1 putative oxidoreductase [Caldisericum exile AZM16c01]
MDVSRAIETRRAYRSLEPFEITEDLIKDLAHHASLAPSCTNTQPWRYVFVYKKEALEKLFEALPKGNQWVRQAGMVIAVFTSKDLACNMRNGIYAYYDTGLSNAFLILRATELGLVAHPIAGYDENIVKSALNIPENFEVIALIVVAKHSSTISPLLSEKQIQTEHTRPERKKFEEFCYMNKVE